MAERLAERAEARGVRKGRISRYRRRAADARARAEAVDRAILLGPGEESGAA
jgi:hypothetical protein